MASISRSRADWIGFRSLGILGVLSLSAVISHITFANDQFIERPGTTTRLEQLGALRLDVAAQQESLSAYDVALLAPLNSLAEALVSADAYQEALTAVEQQIQIIRINDGLYTEAQIPLIEQQLAILAAQRDWNSIADKMVYLSLLLDRAQDMPFETRLVHMKQLRDWGRLLLARGPRAQEHVYVLQLQSIEESILQAAQNQEIEPALMQDLVYDRATAELYYALAIVTPGETSRQLQNRNEGSDTLLPRRDVALLSVSDAESIYGPRTSTVIERNHRMAMARHQEMISSLADVYDDDGNGGSLPELKESDPEQAAMIQLFLADSVLLRQQYELRSGSFVGSARGSNSTGSAVRYYQEAWDLLLTAGYSIEQLNEYFSCPALLPLNQFSARLSELANPCSRASGNDGAGTAADADGIELPDVAVVRGGVPGLRYEKLPSTGLISAAEGVKARLEFSIGVNGQPERIKVQATEPESTSSRIRGKQTLESLQFRPVLHDGRPARTETAWMSVYTLQPH